MQNIESQDLGNTEQYLIDAYSEDSNICLICIETIEPKNQVKIYNYKKFIYNLIKSLKLIRYGIVMGVFNRFILDAFKIGLKMVLI